MAPLTWLPFVSAILATSENGGDERSTRDGRVAEAAVEATPDATSPPTDLDAVVVVARRGAARIAPEAELGAADIDALGADDVGAVIERTLEFLGDQGAPTILVNGRRVPDPAVFYGFPPDALSRVEALPAQAAGLYGADPRRRVLNLVMQPRFRSHDGLLEGSRPTAGEMFSLAADARTAAIADDRARQAGARLTRETSLRSDERRSDSAAAPSGDSATLRPQTDTLSANLMRTGSFRDWSTSLGMNGRLQAASLLWRTEAQTLVSRRTLANLAATAGLGGEARGWPILVNLNAQVSMFDQGGAVATQSATAVFSASLEASRSLADLPAGPLVGNVRGEVSHDRSRQRIAGEKIARSYTTGELTLGATIPLSRGAPAEADPANPLSFGESSIQFGASLRRADADSRGGAMTSISWAPVRKLRLTGAWSISTEDLDAGQRSSPLVIGAPIVVYDFQMGAAAEVSPILGGNPELRPPRIVQRSAGLSLGPFTGWQIAASAQFQSLEATDAVGVLPLPTPEIEAALPERFQRSAEGRLLSLDLRPLNLHASRTERLSSNLSFAAPLAGSNGGQPGRLRVALNYAWQIRDDLIIRPGLPRLDRLSGDGGGSPSQELSVMVDGKRGPWGGTVTARWRQGYRVRRAAGRDGPDDLRVADLATVDAKLTYQVAAVRNPPPPGGAPRRSAGSQLEIGIENLFDARPQAELGDGRPAPGYGRDDQDPVGRRLRVALKTRF